MSVVYVPCRSQRLNRETNELYDAFDYSPAEAHGELKFLLSPNANPTGPELQDIVADLHERLQYITNEDWLLMAGSPTLIALCASIAAQYTTQLRLLQWNGKHRTYVPVEALIE